MFDIKRYSLGKIVYLFVIVVVLMSLIATLFFVREPITTYIYDSKKDKVLSLAYSIASSQQIRDGLSDHGDEQSIQPYAEELREKAGVRFVTVMDEQGIRKSHPNPQMIGKKFQGGDELTVLESGETTVNTAEGSLGLSVRAITPVWNERGQIIGAVAVGVALDDVNSVVATMAATVIVGSFFGLYIGIIGATLMIRWIKHTLFDLEPYEIAKLFHERKALLDSVQDGIISLDEEKKITLINESAKRKFMRMGISQEQLEQDLTKLFPNQYIEETIEQQKPLNYQEITVNDQPLIVNFVPILEENKVQGILISFQDRLEMKKMAEQLTGIKVYAQSLRAQTHEFKNRMHVISGMLHLGHYQELESYIHTITQQNEKDTKFITNYLDDPVLSGFIIAKLSRAREFGVNLTIQIPNKVPLPKDTEVTGALVTIIGNLLENSMEAVAKEAIKNIHLEMFYENEMLDIVVEDTGEGIPEEVQSTIFNKGYSTKGNERGYGLFLLKQSLDELEGTMEVDSSGKKGTQFILSIPYKIGGEQ